MALFTAGGAVYWLMLGVFHKQLIEVVYKGRYGQYSDLLWLVGASLLVSGVVDVLGSALRALERPDQMFWANIFSSVLAIAVGVACMAIWDVKGAAIGLTVGTGIKALSMWIYYRRLVKSAPP